MMRLAEVARTVLDLRRYRQRGHSGHHSRTHAIQSIVVNRVGSSIRVKVVVLVVVAGQQRLLGVQLLVQLGRGLVLLAIAQEQGRNEADQQLRHDDEDDAFPESHIVIEESADEGSDEGAQRKCRRPQTGHQSIRLNVVRKTMGTEMGERETVTQGRPGTISARTYKEILRASMKVATRLADIPKPCMTSPTMMIGSVLWTIRRAWPT